MRLESPSEARAHAIAFHLPQFHPVPENDEWWGAGFTEWTNVVRAQPLFRGHVQPDLPADLGFYDLRLQESRVGQSRLAAQYGLSAFCYWHYWFAGRRILERPVQALLASDEEALPFCLGWANQTWTGIWHGAPNRVLLEQTYPGPEDDKAHFRAVLPAFQDERYFTIDGRPVFYVFRPEELPDARAWTDRWRTLAERAGLPGLYLVAEVSDLLGGGPRFSGVEQAGFDAGVYVRLPAVLTPDTRFKMRMRRKLQGGPEVYPYSAELPSPPGVVDDGTLLPCVYPNWDNTPRSGRRGLVLQGASPRAFERQMRQAVTRVVDRQPGERLLFIKSWNEWAEGNHLEPDHRFGHGWLEALAQGLQA